MPSSVLIMATRYDTGTFYTHAWAKHLQDDLLRRGHTCLMLDADTLCQSGSTLTEVIKRVSYVVFFGHGLADQWIAVPSGPRRSGVAEVPVVSGSNVGVLHGKQVYAGCCHSLAQLGQSFAAQRSGEYVGYSQQFQFETANHQSFRDVVNASVVAYISGDSAQKVKNDIEKEWDNLRHDFMNGRLRHQPNFVMAAQCADDNRQRIGYLP